MSQLSGQLPLLTSKVPSIVRQVQGTLDDRGIPIYWLELPAGETGIGQQAAQLGTSLVENSVSIAGGVASGLFDFVIVLVLSFTWCSTAIGLSSRSSSRFRTLSG